MKKLIGLLLGLTPIFSMANVTISPLEVILTPQKRTAEVIVVNTKNTKETYRLSLVDKVMLHNGSMVDKSGLDSAMRNVFITPREITLNGKGTQTVRVMLRNAEGLQDGEYKTHLTLRHIPENLTQNSAPSGDALSMSITPKYGISIPVFVHIGKLTLTAKIDSVKVIGKEAIVKMSYSGNRSLRGQVNLYQGNTLVGSMKNAAIYKSVDFRTFSIPLNNKYRNGRSIKVEYIDKYTKVKTIN